MADITDKYPKLAQGQAVPANAEDIYKDEVGITDPNLHRRIDDEIPPFEEGEVQPDTYNLTVTGVNSYRTTTHNVHEEYSTTSETP